MSFREVPHLRSGGKVTYLSCEVQLLAVLAGITAIYGKTSRPSCQKKGDKAAIHIVRQKS